MEDDAASSLVSLLEGVQRFSTEIFPRNQDLFAALARGQSPHTLFITCSDSRISPGMITQVKPGNLFVLRNIGNIVPAHGEMPDGVSAAIEYALSAIGVETIIVCGHSDCGAMKALLDPRADRLQAMPGVGAWLCGAEAALAATRALRTGGNDQDALRTLAERNVLLQLANLRTHPAVAAGLADGRLTLQGWFYDIGEGSIWVLDEQTGRAITVAAALARLRGDPGSAPGGG